MTSSGGGTGRTAFTLFLAFLALTGLRAAAEDGRDEVSALNAAIAVARTIESPYERFHRLADIASAADSAFDRQSGIKFLDELHIQAMKVAGKKDREAAIATVADGYIEIGEIDTAVAIYKQLGMNSERIRDLLWWASRIRYAKKFKESDRLLTHMMAVIAEVEMDDMDERNQLISSAAANFAKNGHIDTALEFARSIPDIGRRESALDQVATESIPFRKPKEVLEISAEITDQSTRTRAPLALIKHLCENKRPEEALICLKPLVGNPIWQDRARAFIAGAYAELGQFSESEEIIAGIKEAYALSMATKALAPKLAAHGEIPKAKEYAASVGNDYDRCKVLAAMGGACLSVEKNDEGMAFLDEAKSLAKTFDDPFQKIPLQEPIARAAAENGKLDYALEIAESMTGKGIQLIDKWEVLSLLSWKYFHTGETQKAIKVAGLIRVADERNSSLGSIAQGLAAQGRKAAAMELANRIPKGSDREYSLLYLTWEFTAKRDFITALEVAEMISNPIQKSEALSSIASAYVKHLTHPSFEETEMLRRIIRGAESRAR